MITDKGKSIISKFMLGQTNSYASHIAIGCGAEPLATGADLSSYTTEFAAKTSLDFEMFRVPIISRGYVYEDGVDKLVLTAELPTEERYEITELGLFSLGSNPSVLNDSKQLFVFSEIESWEYHGASSATALPTITSRLDTGNISTGNMANTVDSISTSTPFFAKADNEFFNLTTRLARQERPRYLNNSILIPGDMSGTITTGSGVAWTSSNGYHIHLTNTSFDLDKNSTDDELKLAFSVINKNTTDSAPATVTIFIEFADAETPTQKAQFQYTDSVTPGNRYMVGLSTLANVYKTAGFTWSVATIAKVYVSIGGSANYYVVLDGLRLENKYSGNPLYGMTGYSIIRNTYTDSNYVSYSKPIIKNENTSNYIEFRFAVDVG